MDGTASTESESAESVHPISRVVLVGFMAAGKTEVGAELARRLGWRHVDLDGEIERREGRSVASIFAARGEAYFRAAEARLTWELADAERVVLSPGGGWMTNPTLLSRLGPGTRAVWLRVSPEEAVRRASASDGTRPLLAGADPLGAARRLAGERERFYARAHLAVETDGRTCEDVADDVERGVRARGIIPD
jgi:shikimate kinase